MSERGVAPIDALLFMVAGMAFGWGMMVLALSSVPEASLLLFVVAAVAAWAGAL